LLSLTSCDNDAEGQIIQEIEDNILVAQEDNMNTENVIGLTI
jgi:hypothetical protein